MDSTFESAVHCAAVLIKCLPQRQAGRLLSQLDAKELQAVFKKIRTLGEIPLQQREQAIQRFLKSSAELQSKQPQHREPTERGPFDFLVEVNETTRHRILVGEHPQVVATVLSFLPTKSASAALNSFEPEARVAVLRRLCQLESLDGQEVANISFQLKSRLNRMLKSDRMKQGGIGVATKLLSCADPETQEQLIEILNQQNPDLASELRRNVFHFNDLARLADSDLKTLLKFVDTSLWAPALKSAAPTLRIAVLRNMGPRPRDILNQEIQSSAAVDQILSAQAQSHVIDTCIRLAEQQRITLPAKPESAKA